MAAAQVHPPPRLCQFQPSCLNAQVRDTTHANDDPLKTVSDSGASQLWQAMHVTAGSTHRCEIRKVERKQSSYQQWHAQLREWYDKGT